MLAGVASPFVGMLLSLQDRLPAVHAFPIRLAAYYSYNWYLWHPIFATLFLGPKGQPDAPFDGPRFALYLAFSLGTAVLFTVLLVEEPFLERRRAVIEKIFRKDPWPPTTLMRGTADRRAHCISSFRSKPEGRQKLVVRDLLGNAVDLAFGSLEAGLQMHRVPGLGGSESCGPPWRGSPRSARCARAAGEKATRC